MHSESSRDSTTASSSSLGPPPAWERTIPIGSPWTSLTPGAEALATSTQACPGPALPNFEGDRVLAQSIALMRDAVVLREFVLATCDGDVGRVHEALKVMLSTFAGSTHAKYIACCSKRSPVSNSKVLQNSRTQSSAILWSTLLGSQARSCLLISCRSISVGFWRLSRRRKAWNIMETSSSATPFHTIYITLHAFSTT